MALLQRYELIRWRQTMGRMMAPTWRLLDNQYLTLTIFNKTRQQRKSSYVLHDMTHLLPCFGRTDYKRGAENEPFYT